MVSLIPGASKKIRGKFQNDTSVLVVKGAQKMAAASVYVPRVAQVASPGEAFQDQLVTWLLFKLLLLLWVPDHGNFVCTLSEKSLYFHNSLDLRK